MNVSPLKLCRFIFRRQQANCTPRRAKTCPGVINKPDCANRPRYRPPPRLSPLVTYCSVNETILTSSKKFARVESSKPVAERFYCLQGVSRLEKIYLAVIHRLTMRLHLCSQTDKWYRLGPLCCPQPCCPAPYCPNIEQVYCCTGRC